MKIYLGHSSASNYKKELYHPIRNSELNKLHQIILPHEKSNKCFSSLDFLKGCDLMIAEVSYPSIGLGIELGWAYIAHCQIICIYKKGGQISDSLKTITDKIFDYADETDLISKLTAILK